MSDCHSGMLVKIPVFPDVKPPRLIYTRRHRRCEGAAISRKIGNCTPKDGVTSRRLESSCISTCVYIAAAAALSSAAYGPTTSGRVIWSCTSSYRFKAGGSVFKSRLLADVYSFLCFIPHRGLSTGRSPIHRFLPSVHRIYK
jgi:hypothetical protein